MGKQNFLLQSSLLPKIFESEQSQIFLIDSQIFIEIGHVDIAVANTGFSQEYDYFADIFDTDGKLEKPFYAVFDVNYRTVLNFVKLSLSTFHK